MKIKIEDNGKVPSDYEIEFTAGLLTINCEGKEIYRDNDVCWNTESIEPQFTFISEFIVICWNYKESANIHRYGVGLLNGKVLDRKLMSTKKL